MSILVAHASKHGVTQGIAERIPSTPDAAGRLLRLLPAGRNLLPEGDFRDGAAIDAWAQTIARDLPATR